MNAEERHRLRNSLTEHSKRYKYVNPNLNLCYSGLSAILSKLVHILFILTIRTVKYGHKGKIEKGDDRIFTNTLITMDYILENAKSMNYADGKKIANDRCNWEKHLKELHDNNVYYFWKYRDFYIFIMEREFASWIFYNEVGYVTPKTIIKIIVRADDMMDSMERYVKNSGKIVNRRDIENKFGVFINDMIGKMNPLTASEKLPKWTGEKSINIFLENLLKKMSLLEEYDGLVEHETFMSRLPLCVRETYLDALKNEHAKEVNMKIDSEKDLVDAIVPKESNLTKKKRKKRKTKQVVSNENPDPKKPVKMSYGGKLSPFKNSLQLLHYYRAFLQQRAGSTRIRFDGVESDVMVAGTILDLLQEKNRKTKEFLDAWLEYFFDNDLKGNKIYEIEHTSMRTFSYTFKKFDETFYIPQ